MVSSRATTVAEYLASLPADRRKEIERVRDVVRSNLPKGYEEGMQYGMIGWYVPFSRLAETYNGQPLSLAALAAQKNRSSLYLMTPYGDPETNRWFRDAWKKTGKKLDMGKSCIRFESADDLALDVIAATIRRVGVDEYVARYQQARARHATTKKKAVTKAPAKKAAAKTPRRRAR